MTARDLFAYPDHAYLLSHSVGVQPKSAQEALEAHFLEPWRAARGDAWDFWLKALDDFRSGLGPLIGADAKDICQQTNVSGGLSKILFSLPERRNRRKLVLTEEDFPTIGHVLAQAKRFGYELIFLPGGARLAEPDAWAEAFRDDVQLLHITHVFSNRGVRPPVAEIIARARKAGVITVLDIAQSAGAVPVALNDWRPDFATGTSVKYLCGGPGAAFLWANPETVVDFKPIDVGWFSQSSPFPADLDRFEYAPDARRFLGGTPSVAPFVLAGAAAKTLGEIGIDAIFSHNQGLISRLLDAIPEELVISHVAPETRGSAVIIRPEDPDAASKHLFEEGFIHDRRMDGLRLSMHVYNDAAEVDALADILNAACG